MGKEKLLFTSIPTAPIERPPPNEDEADAQDRWASCARSASSPTSWSAAIRNALLSRDDRRNCAVRKNIDDAVIEEKDKEIFGLRSAASLVEDGTDQALIVKLGLKSGR